MSGVGGAASGNGGAPGVNRRLGVGGALERDGASEGVSASAITASDTERREWW